MIRGVSMEISFSLCRILSVLGLSFFFGPGQFPASAQDNKSEKSGIELVGRTDKEEAPAAWYLHDSQTQKQIAEIRSRWGFQPLPPGKYSLSLSWKYGEGRVPYTEVQVEKDRIVQVKISSGIELAGRSDKEEAPAA